MKTKANFIGLKNSELGRRLFVIHSLAIIFMCGAACYVFHITQAGIWIFIFITKMIDPIALPVMRILFLNSHMDASYVAYVISIVLLIYGGLQWYIVGWLIETMIRYFQLRSNNLEKFSLKKFVYSKLARLFLIWHSLCLILTYLAGFFLKKLGFEFLASVFELILLLITRIDLLASWVLKPFVVPLIDYDIVLLFIMAIDFLIFGGLQWYLTGWVIENFFKLISKNQK